MHAAAEHGKMAELELVAGYAPDRINETDSVGQTPLHFAAGFNQEAVSFLLSAGANVNQTDKYGNTALSMAITYQVKQLLRDAGGHR